MVNFGVIKNIEFQRPFAVGIFCGHAKPSPLPTYLQDFINEFNYFKTGFIHNSRTYFINCHSIVCDSPAKTFIKCSESPNGHSCCDKWTDYGQHINGRIVLRNFFATKRTDVSFRCQLDEDHHVRVTPLTQLDIDMIHSFPVDYMHNVCLGIMRKLLNYWFGGSLRVRLPGRLTSLISRKLVDLKQYIPCEINCKPRSLTVLPRFKASEFQTFLLYTGIIVLKDVISESIYKHFLLLHVAITCLMTRDDTARELNCELA